MKIIQLTDTHLVEPGARLYGMDPCERVSQLVAHICEHQADADLLVITGDIANDGNLDAYRQLREVLSPLPMPCRLLLGNHDRRDTFLEAFPESPVDDNGFVQSVLDLEPPSLRLLFLDSQAPGVIGGIYCADRLRWLHARLQERPDVPVVVFLHHPPVPHGMRHFKHIGFHDGESVMTLLRAHPGGVRHIIFGHIHVPLSGVTSDGMPFSAGRGSNHQFIPGFDDPTPFWTSAPLNYSIITLNEDGVFVHGYDMIECEGIVRARNCLGP